MPEQPQQIIQVAVAMATVVTPPTISIGTNAPNYNNIKSASVLTTILNSVTPGVSSTTQPDSPVAPIPGNTDIYANVTGLALAGTYKVKFAIAGFYDG